MSQYKLMSKPRTKVMNKSMRGVSLNNGRDDRTHIKGIFNDPPAPLSLLPTGCQLALPARDHRDLVNRTGIESRWELRRIPIGC